MQDVLRQTTDGTLLFFCPGCETYHQVWPKSKPGNGPRWEWNGRLDKPTFQPSILVRWSHGVPSAVDPEVREKIRSGEIVQTQVDEVCHSFVTDGKIQYLNDCTHALAGQTIDLPPVDLETNQ